MKPSALTLIDKPTDLSGVRTSTGDASAGRFQANRVLPVQATPASKKSAPSIGGKSCGSQCMYCCERMGKRSSALNTPIEVPSNWSSLEHPVCEVGSTTVWV